MAAKKITDVPKNVKEAIDWLIRIGDLDKNSSSSGQPNSANASALSGAIQKLTGSTRSFQSEIKPLIEKLSEFIGYKDGEILGAGHSPSGIATASYYSAYSLSAQWPTCGKGQQCSCCQGSCNCQSTGTTSCNGQCCNTCDVRICAGIFVALVPALETALEDLKKRCNESDKKNEMITSEGLKGYFTALGYDGDQLNNELKGTIASSKLINATSKLREISKKIKDAFEQRTDRYFTATTTAVSASSPPTSATPRTVREMLLWLMGLPYCQGYKAFVDKLGENKSIVSSSTRDSNPLAKELSAVIFHLPTVFFTVEGRISYLNEVFEQFKNDGNAKQRFNYPTTAADLLKTLSAYVAVCYPILKYLMQRCDKETSRRGARGPRGVGGRSITPTEEKNGSWGDLLVSGNENSSEQGQQAKSSGATPSTAPTTALKDFLVFMGFQTGNDTVTGDDLYDNALKDCFSGSMKTDDEDEEKEAVAPGLSRSGNTRSSKNYQKLPALRKLAKHVLQQAYSPGAAGAGGGGSSSNGTTPTTIRQMMLWLIGLPLTTAYKKGSDSSKSSASTSLFGDNGPVVAGINQNEALKELEQGQSGRRGRTYGSTSANGKHFKQQLKDSIVGMIMLFQRIEGGLGSVLDFLKGGFKDDQKQFKYDDKGQLFNDFKGYVYKVHVQLRFLKVMCKVDGDKGGWSKCRMKATGGQSNSLTCNCTGKGLSVSCHDALNGFLIGGSTSTSENKFVNGDAKMGFKSIDLSNSNTGKDIYNFLKDLIDEIPTTATQPSSQSTPSSKPLSLLTQYCVAIGPLEPDSLGDHFDVFRELANGMWSKIEGEVKKEIKLITTADTDGSQASGKLQGALKAVWPGTHTPPKDHTGDLRSLTGCNGGSSNNCIPFIASLSHGLYRYFDPKLALESRNQSDVINWLYMKMSGLYGKLTALKTEMTEKCKCCPNGETKPTGCNGITQCPNCLPLMYKMGLVFGDPVTISTNKCSELMEKMKKVLDATSKLCVVFRSIDDKRFWPYLLFSARVVKGKNEKGELTVNGDENINCYTKALGNGMYDEYIKKMQGDDEKKAKENKTERQKNLACTCSPHSYTAPQTKQVTPIHVTLTLYFQDSNIKTAIQLSVPHHYPFYNPLVRLYPRNLKSIVDWLLRIGQTRLGQGTSAASTNDTGLKEMCNTFFPKIQECLKEKDKNVFKQLVTNVMSLMGLENKGKQEVETEVEKEFKDVTEKLNKKLNGGDNGFDKTFNKILTFKPNKYIDKVIEDFGKRVCKVQTNGESKDRSFNCVAEAVSKCMKTALDKIQNLAQDNKSEMDKYKIVNQPEIINNDIEEVTQLTTINDLKKLCDGFQKFHEAYDKVTRAFGNHLSQAQQNGASAAWTKINKCVDAFQTLGGCATVLNELNSMSNATQMPTASQKLQALSQKLNTVIDNLKDGDIQTFTEKVNEFIKELDENHLKTKGMSELETALEINNGSSTKFDQLLRTYVSTLITKMKQNSIGDNNNTVYDIHLRVRNDLLQLSECLKVMCEVCGTGIKEFATTLKECVEQGKTNLEKINGTRTTLTTLKTALEEIKEASSQDSVKDKVKSAISTIHSLLSNQYIYNPPPLVSEQINNTDSMTTYLKSLPDLIRDRYVLQKWKDSPEDFCGVQEFKEGIVKTSDINGITGVLQELLSDTYHNATSVTIHDFQVRALIYNFCHKEAMEKIGSGVRLLYFVDYHINGAQNGKNSHTDLQWNTIQKKTELKGVVDDISGNSYLRYFASHLRDSIGYHTLSNTLGALENVKTALGTSGSTQPNDWDKIQELLKKDAIDELYKRLQALVDHLNREYIFEYPPFDWTKSCQRLVEANEKAAQGSRAKRSTDTSTSTTTPTICDMCVPSMAHIFVGFVPQMYRLFKMLREMTQKNGNQHKLEYANNGRDETNRTMSSLAGILSREGWRMKLGSGTSGDPELGYDLDASKTGADVCTLLEKIIGDKEPGALVAQKGDTANTTDASLMPLDQLFKAVMQHFRTKRDEKIKAKHKALKAAFEADTNNAGLKFVPPPPVLPSTVRQVLFWLHEMDTNKVFYDAMSEHINTLCQRSTIGISQDTILHVLKLSITQCLEVLATIEDPGRQNADYYYELYTEEHYYAYPEANIPLFFYTFVEKLMGAFLELNFVCVQCEFRATEGGWKDCEIGKAHKGAYEVQGSVCCICHERKTVGTPIHAVTVSGSVVCPRPLSAFLFSDQKNQLRIPSDVSQRLPYMSKGTMPCGFQLKNKAITDAATKGDAHTSTSAPTAVSGSVLVEPLRKLVGGHVTGRLNDTSTRKDENNTLCTVIYLRDLLRYVLCLAVRPPWSMSENMAFFYRVTESWKKNNNVVGGARVALNNPTLRGAIHNEIALFPGTFKAELLTTAVERFAGVEGEHKKNTAVSPQNSHQYDLRTLMGCQEKTTTGTSAATATAQCSPFMFPLSLDVYTHYDHKNSRAYLSWILNFAFGIYGQLKALEEMIEQQQCITKGNSSCPSLPMCPGVLSALYQSGSSFMDQGKLAEKKNGNKKTCAQFRDVLSGLFSCHSASCSPLHNLIVQCEAFLWSIRLPFSLVQLSLWSFAVLFISYVFVVPLDHFKIKSHLFNRLKYTMHPSLLIADSQRRVSEVAYFSL